MGLDAHALPWHRSHMFERPFNPAVPRLDMNGEAVERNSAASLHCPSFRHWRPELASGVFFF